ncbi:hypothetical protein D9M68_964170 [compost metagenome]
MLQTLDLGAAKADAAALGEEVLGLFGVEAQVGGINLSQGAACTQAGQADLRQSTTANNKAGFVRERFNAAGHQAQNDGVANGFEVVEENRHRGLEFGDPVEDPGDLVGVAHLCQVMLCYVWQ